VAAVHAAVLVGARPGHRPVEKEPLFLDGIDMWLTAERAERLAGTALGAGVIFIFSAGHLECLTAP